MRLSALYVGFQDRQKLNAHETREMIMQVMYGAVSPSTFSRISRRACSDMCASVIYGAFFPVDVLMNQSPCVFGHVCVREFFEDKDVLELERARSARE